MKNIKTISALSLAALMSVSMLNTADARGGKGGKHGGGYHHGASKVEKLAAYLGLDETQTANLQALADLKEAQRDNEEIDAARQAVADAAAAEVFSSFTYTEAVAALTALRNAQITELAATKAVFLESLTAEQRAMFAAMRRYHR